MLVRASSVRCASASCSYSERSDTYAPATSAITPIRTVRCASAVAKYSASAASDRLRTRPNRSSSYALMPTPARYSPLTALSRTTGSY